MFLQNFLYPLDYRDINTVHKGERPYKCEYCDHSSKCKSDLNSHIKDIHKGNKDHKCEYCGKGFAQAGSMKKHIILVHNENP